uniref:Folate receptor-like domain-containing protein n=1 Tax=Tetradesmus obliquus TaxID=3088 RepID=A0A383V7S8_TETOB|eukprot:jgi/Sobl393_1/16249/SZX60644.1
MFDQRLHVSLPSLLLLCLAAAQLHSTWALGQLHAAAVLEAIPQENLIQGRNALEKWEQHAASESGLMNIILGNTCFTSAISAMKQGCTKTDSTNRCWLAIQFTMCFQRASGFKVLDCPTACPKYKRLQACVEDCTAKMDQNTYTTYTQFFGDVFNMCLFLQTQNFQEWTTALVQDMHSQTAAANASLSAIKGQLTSQQQLLQQSLQSLADLQTVQLQVADAAQAGLAEVQAVGALSVGIQQSVNESLAMTGNLSSRQQQLLHGFGQLEQKQKQQAEQAATAWQQLAADAAALEERQVRYESLQSQLLNASEGLLQQSQGIARLMELLLHYQHSGASLLHSLHSSSTTLQDIGFYAACLSVPLLFFTHPPDARLLLLLSVLAAWVAERAALQHILPLQHMLLGGGGGLGAAGGAAAAGGGMHYSYLHAVKLGVRVAVLGGGAGLALWMLLRRHTEQQRKEELFQQLKRSYDAASAASAAGQQGFYEPATNAPTYYQQPMQHVPAAPAAATATKRGKKANCTAVAGPSSLQTAAAPLTPAVGAAGPAALVSAHLAHMQLPAHPQHVQQQQQQLSTWVPHQLPYYHPSQAAAAAAAAAVTPAQHRAAAAAQAIHPSMLQHGTSQGQYAAGPAMPLGGQLQLLQPAVSADQHHGAASLSSVPEEGASDMQCEAAADSEQPSQQQQQSTRRPAARSKTAAAAAGASAAAAKGKPKAAAGKRGRAAAAAVADDAAASAGEEEEESKKPQRRRRSGL